jgi:chaperonin GroES
VKGVDDMGDFPLGVDPKPINGRVLIRMIGNSRKTSGGIHIPDTAHEYPVQGVVEELSPGWYEEGLFRGHQVAIGDTVIFNWKAGFDLLLDETEFRLIHEKEILAILRGVNYG